MEGHTNALNCENRPYYAANILLELHLENSEYFVMIKYDG